MLKRIFFSKKNWFDFAIILVAGVLIALSVVLFFDPHNIVPGGLTGVAMMINYKIPQMPIGTLILIMNLPLFLFGWKILGHSFFVKTIFGTISSSVTIDLLSFIPPPECDPLAAGVLGGFLGGFGLGLIFYVGATTGGSDIAARLIKVAFPSIQMGTLMMLIDGIIVIASIFVYGSFNNAFYAIAGVYAAMLVTDLILYGVNVQWTAYIISEKYEVINQAIHSELGRGSTLIHAEGGFKGTPRKVILCAVRRQQIAHLKATVKELDPDAFIIVNKAYEVLGEGFLKYDKNRV